MKPPITHIYDLNRLPGAGIEIEIASGPDELAQFAQWAGVDAVVRFDSRVTLRKLSQTQFIYAAELFADIVQSCVVTLKPVHSHIAHKFTRTLLLTSSPARSEAVTLDPGDDDSPDEIESSRYDLAMPLLEELALAIDPYPRAEGVAFEALAPGPVTEESPFAVLKALKPRG